MPVWVAFTIVSVVFLFCLTMASVGFLLPQRWNLLYPRKPEWMNHDGTHISDVGVRPGTKFQHFQEWFANKLGF